MKPLVKQRTRIYHRGGILKIRQHSFVSSSTAEYLKWKGGSYDIQVRLKPAEYYVELKHTRTACGVAYYRDNKKLGVRLCTNDLEKIFGHVPEHIYYKIVSAHGPEKEVLQLSNERGGNL